MKKMYMKLTARRGGDAKSAAFVVAVSTTVNVTCRSGFIVEGFRFGVWGLRFGIRGLGTGVRGFGFRV